MRDAKHAGGQHRGRSLPILGPDDPPRVLIWHEQGGVGHDIAYMYKPIVDTLTEAFRTVPADIAKSIGGQPHVVVGQGLTTRLHRIIGGLRPEGDFVKRGCERKGCNTGPSQLRRGDVFIWVGLFSAWEVPWQSLRRQGVRTVYFQVEPADGCAIRGEDYHLHGQNLQPDELWDYSLHNVDKCKVPPTSNIKYRFVPPGYVAAPTTRDAGGMLDGDRIGRELIFLGYPYFKSGRRYSYGKLKERLGENLNATFKVWNADAFDSWWKERGQWAMHVNLHKICCDHPHMPLETVRIASLLSVGATILSEPSYKRDQALYEGLVHFGSVEEMPAMMRAIQTIDGMHPSGRAVAWRQRQQQVIDRFRERFRPQAILQSAGAYSVLQHKRGAPPPATTTVASSSIPAAAPATLTPLPGAPLKTESIRVSTQPPFNFVYNPRDLDMRVLKEHGMLEPMMTWAFHELAGRCCRRTNGLIIDIGANYGWYTLYARALGCKVVVFEPVPAYAAVVRAGLAANPGFASGVELHENVAYYTRGDVYTLNVPRPERYTQHGMTGMSGRIGLLKGYPSSETIQVNASSVRVDDLVPAGTDVCLLKADIEGYEAHALAGARRLLGGGTVRTLMLELTRGGHPDQRERMGADNVLMLRRLEKLGYTVRQVPNHIYLANASLPGRVADWRRYGPWDALPAFPSAATRTAAKQKGAEAMELAYTRDFTSHSTNLVARLRKRGVRESR